MDSEKKYTNDDAARRIMELAKGLFHESTPPYDDTILIEEINSIKEKIDSLKTDILPETMTPTSGSLLDVASKIATFKANGTTDRFLLSINSLNYDANIGLLSIVVSDTNIYPKWVLAIDYNTKDISSQKVLKFRNNAPGEYELWQLYNSVAGNPLKVILLDNNKIEGRASTVELVSSPVREDIPNDFMDIDIPIVPLLNEVSAISDLKAYIGYTDSDVVGICADFENNKCERLGAAIGLSAGSDFDKFRAFGDRQRCIVDDDGIIIAFREPTQSLTKYTLTEKGSEKLGLTGQRDQTISVSDAESGNYGQVMVYQPKFYYKVVPVKTELFDKNRPIYASNESNPSMLLKANYYISDNPKPGFKLHPAFIHDGKELNYILLAAYEASIEDSSGKYTGGTTSFKLADKLSSVAINDVVHTNIGKNDARTLATNRGDRWHERTVKEHCVDYLLLAIEYATFNSLIALTGKASNFNDSSIPFTIGTTSSLGNSSGLGMDDKGLTYRGEENIFGNGKGYWAEGLEHRGSDGGYYSIYVADHDFSENVSYKYSGISYDRSKMGTGYAKVLAYSETMDWLFWPLKCGGTSSDLLGFSTTIRSDYQSTDTLLSASSLGNIHSYYVTDTNGKSANTTGRLSYYPKPMEEA